MRLIRAYHSNSAIQYLYGANAMESGTLSPGRTMPPSDMMGEDMSDMGMCEELRFDAILQHSVNNDHRTFAFMGDYYVELNDYGLAYVSARSALYLGLCQQAHTFRVVAVFFLWLYYLTHKFIQNVVHV